MALQSPQESHDLIFLMLRAPLFRIAYRFLQSFRLAMRIFKVYIWQRIELSVGFAMFLEKRKIYLLRLV